MSNRTQGSCLCGEVRYEFSGPAKVFQYCHCSRCRKFTGSAHAANIIIAPENFVWLSGEDSLGRFEHPEAKYFATCFCQKCGSSLPWLVKNGRSVVIPAGTLDADPGIRPMHNIFWKNRVEWRVAIEDLPHYDELPV